MLAEEYILIYISLISCIMVRLFFATSIEIYSGSAFLIIFSYRADESQNISTAERALTRYANEATFIFETIFCIFELMNKQSIIDRTIKAINQLPEDKAEEISVFADFLIKRYEEQKLTEGIQKLTANSQSFNFLNEEEDIYSEDDLKEIYNAQG